MKKKMARREEREGGKDAFRWRQGTGRKMAAAAATTATTTTRHLIEEG